MATYDSSYDNSPIQRVALVAADGSPSATSGIAGVVSLGTLLAGEDLTNNVLKVEQRFSFSNVTGDTAVKSGAGFLHSVTFAQTDAAPTAGSIILYDNTAESGTIIQTVNFTTAVFQPYTLIYDCSFATGLYVGFTTTADVNVTVTYR